MAGFYQSQCGIDWPTTDWRQIQSQSEEMDYVFLVAIGSVVLDLAELCAVSMRCIYRSVNV